MTEGGTDIDASWAQLGQSILDRLPDFVVVGFTIIVALLAIVVCYLIAGVGRAIWQGREISIFNWVKISRKKATFIESAVPNEPLDSDEVESPTSYQPASGDWAKVERPALWQAACLWVDLEPYKPVKEGTPAYPALQMLKSEIMKGSIDVEVYGGSDDMHRLTRNGLVDLAKRTGDRPKFLFPEE